MSKIVRIKKYPKDHVNGYARVERQDKDAGYVIVSNMNMPFCGTLGMEKLNMDEVEFVRGIGA